MILLVAFSQNLKRWTPPVLWILRRRDRRCVWTVGKLGLLSKIERSFFSHLVPNKEPKNNRIFFVVVVVVVVVRKLLLSIVMTDQRKRRRSYSWKIIPSFLFRTKSMLFSLSDDGGGFSFVLVHTLGIHLCKIKRNNPLIRRTSGEKVAYYIPKACHMW